MKKILALVLVLLLAVPFVAMAEENPTVKIGVFEPASGDSGAGGKQEILGMQYANYVQPTVDIGGTTYNVELVYRRQPVLHRQGSLCGAAAGQRGRERGAWLLRLRRLHRGRAHL